MKKVNLETLRCSVVEANGQQCPSDFTRKMAFAPSIESLAHKRPVTLQAIADNAICPFHAAELTKAGETILPLEMVLAEHSRIVATAREREMEERRRAERRTRAYRRWEVAHTTTLATAMHAAGF